MARKKVVRKTTKSQSNSVSHSIDPRRTEMDKLLIENFVTLQRVLTNLSKKFDELSDNLTKMFNLFEISAKTFVDKHEGSSITKEEKDFVEKLDKLLEQNKLIAKGLTLMEDRIRGGHQPQSAPAPPQYPPANPSVVSTQYSKSGMLPSIKQDNIKQM